METANIESLISRITTLFSPLSIFLYGSRARDDYLPDSDYEIGVLFSAADMIDESALQGAINADKQYRIYPYEVNSFISGDFDLPFEITIFLKKVSLRGRTIWGKKVIESMETPPVTVVSVMRDIKFQIGRASDAVVCGNLGYDAMASQLFFKSCLLGSKDLIILETRTFPVSYKEILASSKNLNLEEYAGITDKAYLSRTEKVFKNGDLLKNIWFLNRLVERRIIDFYRKNGDAILIK